GRSWGRRRESLLVTSWLRTSHGSCQHPAACPATARMSLASISRPLVSARGCTRPADAQSSPDSAHVRRQGVPRGDDTIAENPPATLHLTDVALESTFFALISRSGARPFTLPPETRSIRH